jgi:hypothetical protein
MSLGVEMRTHQEIDERSLRLAAAVVARIEADPERRGLVRARAVCRRWLQREPLPVYREWLAVLQRPWPEVRRVLCDRSEQGRRLRQSDPFCGVLTPQERWAIYREFRGRETRGS